MSIRKFWCVLILFAFATTAGACEETSYTTFLKNFLTCSPSTYTQNKLYNYSVENILGWDGDSGNCKYSRKILSNGHLRMIECKFSKKQIEMLLSAVQKELQQQTESGENTAALTNFKEMWTKYINETDSCTAFSR